MAMSIKRIAAGFVIPAGLGVKTAGRRGLVHEIKHDGYRMIVRRDGSTVRLYSRNAHDRTVRWLRSPLLPSGSRPRHPCVALLRPVAHRS
jgi:hypothetical protein